MNAVRDGWKTYVVDLALGIVAGVIASAILFRFPLPEEWRGGARAPEKSPDGEGSSAGSGSPPVMAPVVGSSLPPQEPQEEVSAAGTHESEASKSGALLDPFSVDFSVPEAGRPRETPLQRSGLMEYIESRLEAAAPH